MKNNFSEELLEFIKKSPTCYHAVDTIKKMLDEQGFIRLNESAFWDIKPGGR